MRAWTLESQSLLHGPGSTSVSWALGAKVALSTWGRITAPANMPGARSADMGMFPGNFLPFVIFVL